MKPYRPEVLQFSSDDKTRSLEIPLEGERTWHRKTSGDQKAIKWPVNREFRNPGQVIFFPELGKLVFLGGAWRLGVLFRAYRCF